MEDLKFFSKYLALVVAIIGTIKYKDIKHSKAKYFLFSIWYIMFTEFVASNFNFWFGKPNYIVYNIYLLVQFTFYLWWFRILLKAAKRKKIVLGFVLFFICFFIVDVLFLQSITEELLTYSYAISVILTVTSICYYFIEVFNSEVVLKIRESIYFWFSIGILIFHAAFMPFLFTIKFFLSGDSRLLRTVQFFLAALMYIFFTIGFFKAKHSADEHKLI